MYIYFVYFCKMKHKQYEQRSTIVVFHSVILKWSEGEKER